MPTRWNYWTCSDFADWLRGTPKPPAASGEEWDSWGKHAKNKHPIRYWLAEEGLDKLQNFVYWIPDKLHSIIYYINNRWITKTHVMTTGLKPGVYHDFSEILINGMFNELVDFVEVETAWYHVCWDKETCKKFHVPWWARKRFYRQWRNPEAGIAHLKWASALIYNEDYGIDETHELWDKSTDQANGAVEILELYNWWKNIRPNRPEAYDVSGWSKYCADKFEKEGFRVSSKDDSEITKPMLDMISKIEAEYHNEDTEMMVRLVKIRDYLWT